MEPKSMGDVLKDIRVERGMSQSELATILGYKDRTTVAKLESGENGLPAGKAAIIAEKLGVTEAYLTNSLERTLYALDVIVEYKGSYVRVYDEEHGRELRYEPSTWRRLKEEDGFRTVWDRLSEAESTDRPIVEASALSPRGARVGFLYDRADERDRKLVDTVLDVYEEQDDPVRSTPIPIKEEPARAQVTLFPKAKVKRRKNDFDEMTVYEEPTAAGFGNYLSGTPATHIEQYPSGMIPEGTNYGVPISGNSMMPKFKDGSTAFVQATPAINDGEIGLFSLNGNSYIKQLVVDREHGTVRLHSLNPNYDDIEVHEGDYLYTFGRILASYPV